MEIRALDICDLDDFFVYLNDHLSDNGMNGTSLFMPMSRSESRFPPEREAAFRAGVIAPVGQPGWRRAFIATDTDGRRLGHVDLRARPERTAAHRALLGMGVHRDARRQGVGARLMEFILGWAREQEGLAWVDLEVLGVNGDARRLYQRFGFVEVSDVADMYRIDGTAQNYVSMVLKL